MRLKKNLRRKNLHVVTSHEGIGLPTHLNWRGSLVNENMKKINRGRYLIWLVSLPEC
jgi:hypothetical protein